MSNKKFEDILRQKFAEATSEPEPGLKEKIFVRNKAAKQRRLFSLISVAASLSIIVVSLVFIFTGTKKDEPLQAGNTDKHVSDTINNVPDLPLTTEKRNNDLPEQNQQADKVEEVKWLSFTADQHPRHLELPDGSKVVLNKNSQLKYREDFTRNRELQLNGEAFFEVVKSEVKFEVVTSQLRVTVLGTSFNVLDRNNENAAVYTVSGKVQVTGGESEVTLLADDYCIIKNRELLKGKGFDRNKLAWKTGILAFQQVPVNEVVTALEEYYQVKIEVAVDNECKVTSTFLKKDLPQAMEMLSQITGLRVEKLEEGYKLSGNCR